MIDTTTPTEDLQAAPAIVPQATLRVTIHGPLADAVRVAATRDKRSISCFLEVHLPKVPEIAAALPKPAPKRDYTDAERAQAAAEWRP